MSLVNNSNNNTINEIVEQELHRLGAEIVGFGDITALPEDIRAGLPIGISIAVVYPKEIIRGIVDLPTQDYCDWYNKLNDCLDTAVAGGAEMLKKLGYRAIALTRDRVGKGEDSNHTDLPHKTIATRAGIGWIGKSALLLTKEYGSAIRLSSILTDAPLETATPKNESLCGSCMICANACPAHAISGKPWQIDQPREICFDPVACRKIARERAKHGFGGEDITICGKCIEICPYTRRYL
jgi:epoxyqueuosine reductase QueG